MNNSIYLKNHDILKKRWPTIIDYLESLDGDIDISFLEDSTVKGAISQVVIIVKKKLKFKTLPFLLMQI